MKSDQAKPLALMNDWEQNIIIVLSCIVYRDIYFLHWTIKVNDKIVNNIYKI